MERGGLDVHEDDAVTSERNAVLENLPTRGRVIEPGRDGARLHLGDEATPVPRDDVVCTHSEARLGPVDHERIARGDLHPEDLVTVRLEERRPRRLTGHSTARTDDGAATARSAAERENREHERRREDEREAEHPGPGHGPRKSRPTAQVTIAATHNQASGASLRARRSNMY